MSNPHLQKHSLTRRGRGWIYWAFLLLLCACSSDNDDTTPTTHIGFTVTSVSGAPTWSIDWRGDEDRPTWQTPDPADYENFVVMLIQLEDALQPYSSEDDLLAVFVGNELRGMDDKAVIVGEEDDSAPLTCFVVKAYGNEADQKMLDITLKYYCARLKQTFARTVRMRYVADEVYGIDDDIIPQFTLGPAKFPVVETIDATALNTCLSRIYPQPTPAAGDIVAAFVGNECRGVSTFLSTLPSLTVYGRQAGEVVTLKYYSAASQQVYTINNALKL